MVRLLLLSLVILALILDVDASGRYVYFQFKERNALCRLPFRHGNCGGFRTAWYYNDDTKKCEKILFSSCQENWNRFVSKEMCIGFCIEYRYLRRLN